MKEEVKLSLLGLTEEEAKKFCETNDYNFRIVRKDSVYFVITCDCKFNRLNLELDEGKITKVYFG